MDALMMVERTSSAHCWGWRQPSSRRRMCFGRGDGILVASSLGTERAECAQPGNPQAMKRQGLQASCAIHREGNTRMSQQSEHEALTPQRLYQALVSEIEASQQTLAQLSDERLHVITGGCWDCTVDKRLMTRYTNKAHMYRALAVVAHDLEDAELTAHYSRVARAHRDAARLTQDRIHARRRQRTQR